MPVWASLVAKLVKNLPAVQETPVHFLGQEDPLEKGMGTPSSILAWRIPWTAEPDGLQSIKLQSQIWRKCLSTRCALWPVLLLVIIADSYIMVHVQHTQHCSKNFMNSNSVFGNPQIILLYRRELKHREVKHFVQEVKHYVQWVPAKTRTGMYNKSFVS